MRFDTDLLFLMLNGKGEIIPYLPSNQVSRTTQHDIIYIQQIYIRQDIIFKNIFPIIEIAQKTNYTQ